MKFIDYTFYNFANLFYKEDGSDGLRASLIISIGYFFLIILASYLIVIIYAGSIEQAKIWLSKNQNNSFLYILVLFPIVTIPNYSHYRFKYYKLKEKWPNHTLKTEPLRIISSMSMYLFIIFLTIYTIVKL